jgi:hypothetical protein
MYKRLGNGEMPNVLSKIQIKCNGNNATRNIGLYEHSIRIFSRNGYNIYENIILTLFINLMSLYINGLRTD